MENATPMLRQYLEIKKLYPGTLLFFRLGDFYELFNEDAITGARELQITLTARHKDSVNPIPMCGVPHHAAANYIARLVRKGYRIAICEQAEAATKGTKLVKREVVRVITPGTAVDQQLLDSSESVFLASVFKDDGCSAAAFLDVSTGTFSATQISGVNAWDSICECVESFAPREVIADEPTAARLRQRSNGGDSSNELPGFREDGPSSTSGPTVTVVDEHFFDLEEGAFSLANQFHVRELDAFGLHDRPAAIRAAAAALRYAKETQRAAAEHITDIAYFESVDSMVLDPVTLRNLEICETRNETGSRSLFQLLNCAITGMGARLLRSWLLRPSIKRSEIQTRLNAVTELTDSMLREKIRFLLKRVSDLERLTGRLNLNSASARDLIALGQSLSQVPAINELLADVSSLLLQVLNENIFPQPKLTHLIERAIADEPPVNLSDGGTIRDGFDPELDDLRNISRSAKQTIAAFEEQERTRRRR